MHSLKNIRDNLNYYKKKIQERFAQTNLDELIDLDKKNR